ncbi:MAG: hypothetical protein RBR84_01625 [Bacteroidales bacterium]|jgi:hypothetical protein|nr:hypothetical protein [Bacteroidales bacterium]
MAFRIRLYGLLLLTFLFSSNLVAVEGTGPVGGRTAGMGNASVALSDFWSIHNNPAGIASQKTIAFGIAYQNRFMMQALSLQSAGVVAPTKIGVLGLSFSQFGYTLYKEQKLGLAYARDFGDVLRIGLQLDYFSTSFSDAYEKFQAISFELGVQYAVNEKLTAGAYVFNPGKARLSEYTDERLPVILRFGLAYQFSDQLIGTAEIEKNFDREASIRAGLEYFVLEKFFVRAGINTQPGIFTFGTGFDLGPVRIDLAGNLHQVLGTSIQSSLIIQFGNRNSK